MERGTDRALKRKIIHQTFGNVSIFLFQEEIKEEEENILKKIIESKMDVR